jgi:Ca2+-binding EF-hand superfamily protein
LALLGLFATVDQANALFDKYDTNGDGALTVHEFLTRCRPAVCTFHHIIYSLYHKSDGNINIVDDDDDDNDGVIRIM